MRGMQGGDKWYLLSSEDIAKKLNTDLALGLSKRAAKARRARFGKNTLFSRRGARIRSALLRPMCSVSSVLLAVCCIFGLFFSRLEIAIPALIALALINGIFAFFSVSYERANAKQGALSMPMARVKRDGDVYITNADNITLGDVIILKEGDIVPADARLVSGEGLVVETFTGTSEGGFFYRRDEKNPYEIYGADIIVASPNEKNMLYGGSRVICGDAVAVVVGIGENTHVGAIIGSISLDIPKASVTSGIERYAKYSEIVFLLVSVIVSLIGALVLKKGDIFAPMTVALSLALVNSGITLTESIKAMKARELSLMNSSSGGKLMLKNLSALDGAASLTDVFLLERYALTDGTYTASEAYCADVSYSTSEMADGGFDELFECVYITETMAQTGDGCFSDAVAELAHIRKYDVQALKIRFRNISRDRISIGKADFLEVSGTLEGENVSFALCDDIRALETSRYYIGASGELLLLDSHRRRNIYERFERTIKSGCKAHLYFKMTGQAPILMGMMAFSERAFDGVSDAVTSIKKLGVKTAFFCAREDSSSLAYLENAGLISESCRPVFASAIAKEGKTLAEVYGRGNVFLGFSVREIYELQSALREHKRHSAVLAVRCGELALVKGADISFACDLIDYPSSKLQDAFFDSLPDDNGKNSIRSAQAVKYESDVLLKRSAEESASGPLGSIYKLLRASRSLTWRRALMLSYFLPVQLIRALLVVLCVVFGLGAFSPFSVILSGALLDVLVFWTLTTFRRADLNGFKRAKASISEPLKFSKRRAFSALVLSLAVGIFTIVSSHFIFAPEGALACLCTMLCSVVSLFVLFKEWGAKSAFRAVKPIRLIALLLSLLFVFLLSFVPYVGAVLRIDGMKSLYWLISLIVSPFVFIGAYVLYPRIFAKDKK